MNTVAVEDLMSECIVSWCENLAELGCPRDQSPDMWFRYLSEEQRRVVMDKLLDIIERDYENHKAAKNDNPVYPVCCFCKINDKNIKTTNQGTPMHIQCLHDAGLGNLEKELFGSADYSREMEVTESNNVVVDPKSYDPDCCYCQRDRAILKSHYERSLEVKESNHNDFDPWVCLDCGSNFEPTENTQCPCCFVGYTLPSHLVDDEGGVNVDDSDDCDDCDDSKTITMKEISIELDDDLIEGLLKIARANVVNDKQALINYGANLILKTMIEQKDFEDDNL